MKFIKRLSRSSIKVKYQGLISSTSFKGCQVYNQELPSLQCQGYQVSRLQYLFPRHKQESSQVTQDGVINSQAVRGRIARKPSHQVIITVVQIIIKMAVAQASIKTRQI